MDRQAPAQAGPSPRVSAEFGFNESFGAQAADLESKLGAHAGRMFVPWFVVEMVPGQWDWRAFDAEYGTLLAHGIRPVINAGDAPCWARPLVPCGYTTAAPPDPVFDAAWAEYIHRLTSRYPQALGIEIWNEPNITLSFEPRVDPVRYATLLREAYDEIKRVNPAMTVVSGGLIPLSTSSGFGMQDGEFLAATYDAGAGNTMDAIGTQPYPFQLTATAVPRSYEVTASEQALNRMRTARDAHGGRATPLWITETGVSTATQPGFPPGASESEQAADLVALVGMVRRDGDIHVAIIHRLMDLPSNGLFQLTETVAIPLGLLGEPVLDYSIESGFGVFHAQGAAKPAACRLAAELGGSLVC